jgi:hypothetical protein
MLMRRFALVLAVAALAVPALAAAGGLAVGDGSLGVSGASGTIVVQGRGVIYGHFDSGTLLVLDYRPDDGTSAPSYSGGKQKVTRGTGSVSGNDVRFLFPSGRYTIELIATNINASAVGKGTIAATGLGTSDDGSITVNGGKPEPLTRGSMNDSFGKGP